MAGIQTVSFNPSIGCVSSSKYPPGSDCALSATEIQGYPVADTVPSENDILLFTGGVWTPSTIPVVDASQRARITDTIPGASTSYNRSITYATAFSAVPSLVVTVSGNATYYTRTVNSQVQISNETVTGFDLDIVSIAAGADATVNINYIASE